MHSKTQNSFAGKIGIGIVIVFALIIASGDREQQAAPKLPDEQKEAVASAIRSIGFNCPEASSVRYSGENHLGAVWRVSCIGTNFRQVYKVNPEASFHVELW